MSVYVHPEIHKALKLASVEREESMGDIVEKALRRELGMMEKTYRVSDGVTSEIFEAASAEEALHQMFNEYDWGGATYTAPAPGEDRPADEHYTVWEVLPDGNEVEVLWGHLTEVGAPQEQ